MQPTLVIMAAGMGSRYGGLKQIDPLGPNGETIMDYSIYDALHSGFGKVVFVIREFFKEDFMRVCASRYGEKFSFSFVAQELTDIPEPFNVPQGREKPWGTGQALITAARHIDSPFCIINADDFYGRNTFEVMANYLAQPNLKDGAYSMAGYILSNTLSPSGTVARGVCKRDQNDMLTGVEELLKIERKSDGRIMNEETRLLDDDDLCSMNCWGFTPDILEKADALFVNFLKERGTEMKSEFLLPTIVNQLIKEEKASCRVLKTTAKWFGVTYRDDRPGVVERLAGMHKDGLYPNPLF